jgi:hypothetical protein
LVLLWVVQVSVVRKWEVSNLLIHLPVKRGFLLHEEFAGSYKTTSFDKIARRPLSGAPDRRIHAHRVTCVKTVPIIVSE